MTDCSQLQAAYNSTQAQLNSIPGANNPIQYCNSLYPDDLQRYKSCLAGIRSQTYPLQQQLALLNHEMKICSVLLGTWNWTISFTDMIGISHQVTQTLQITSWDTTGNWTGTLISTEDTGKSETTAVPGTNGSASLDETSLLFGFTVFPDGIMGPYLHYIGHLNMQMNPPVIDQAYFTDSSGTLQSFVATKIV